MAFRADQLSFLAGKIVATEQQPALIKLRCSCY
jgi:hypothetical protein